jgi:flagellar hook-associated protein 3 FlgL
MTRVSTHGSYLLNQSYLMLGQSRLKDTQVQISSGKVAQTYDKLGVTSNQLLQLETSQSRSSQFADNIGRALGRMDVMESTIATLADRATYMLTQLTYALSGENADDIALEEMGAGFREEVAGLINSEHEGRYLFAGSRSDRPPVDLTAYDPTVGLPLTFPADTTYYQGDTIEASVRADDHFEQSYGITGDSPGFEKLLRALSYVEWAGNPAVSSQDQHTVLQQAFDLTKQAINDLANDRSELGAAYSVLEESLTGHEDYLTYVGNAISGIEDVDLAEAVNRITADQTQLEASYMVLNRVNTVSLINFLK